MHVTVDTANLSFDSGVHAYVGSSLGPLPKMDNCVFHPVKATLLVREHEKSSLDALTNAPSNTVDDVPALVAAINRLSEQIDKVLEYVQNVIDGKVQPDSVVGKSLLSAVQALSSRFEEGDLNSILDGHIQDTKAVSYLADLIRTQSDIASRLSLLG